MSVLSCLPRTDSYRYQGLQPRQQAHALPCLPHQAHRFKPVQKVGLKKDVHCTSINDALLAALNMLDPVAARIAQLWRNTASYRLFFHFASQRPRL